VSALRTTSKLEKLIQKSVRKHEIVNCNIQIVQERADEGRGVAESCSGRRCTVYRRRRDKFVVYCPLARACIEMPDEVFDFETFI